MHIIDICAVTVDEGIDGYSQILFRVSIDKNRKLRLKTGVFIPEKRWDEAKGQLSYSRMVGAERKEMAEKDTRLKNIEAKILKLCEVFPDDVLTKEWVENVLKLCEQIDVVNISVSVVDELIKKAQESDLHNRRSFFDYMMDFRNNAKKKVNGKREGEKSDVWKKNFDVLVRALQRYEMFVRLSDKKRKDFMLDIDTFDNEILTDVESYLRNEHTLLEEYPNVFRPDGPCRAESGFLPAEGNLPPSRSAFFAIPFPGNRGGPPQYPY